VSKKEEKVKAVEKKVTTKKKVVKKQPAKKVTTKKTAAKKVTATSTARKLSISPRERYEMIATMAYYRAEQRNFAPGHDVEDWLDCESTIDRMIKG
jgi:hypothetical protein